MVARRRDFYASKGDLERLFREIDSKAPPLKFALCGTVPGDQVRVYDSLLQFSGLGKAISPVAVGNHCFYVVERDSKALTFDSNEQESVVTPDIGSAVFLRLGGVLKDGTLIQSEVSVQSVDPTILKIFDLISRAIIRQSTKIRATRVCAEAEKLLDDGWILTAMANTVKQRKLTRESTSSNHKGKSVLIDFDKL